LPLLYLSAADPYVFLCALGLCERYDFPAFISSTDACFLVAFPSVWRDIWLSSFGIGFFQRRLVAAIFLQSVLHGGVEEK
jgi:hypothetical protein